MSLASGARVGPYEIVAPLGAGGMGEVYRARDPRIGREVAIKVLPEAFATDAERVGRFAREAQVLGSLNHQNIAAIYGVEQDASGSTSAPPVLVMELVEGPTLADRIAEGPIPLAEALAIAAQIAEALEAAHDLGIVHRDLKPANIKLRTDGTVKVLDFGLAKMIDPAGASRPDAGAATYSPTLSLAASRAGMIIGTAAYMAPEQARGRIVDKRADVWAFGVVVYEMLTGAKAFPGEDVSDTLAAVIKFDPDWSKLPADTPASIRRLLKRCLAKDPKLRLRDCGSALLDIRDAQSGAPADGSNIPQIAVPAPRRSWLPLIVVAGIAAAAGGAAWAVVARATAADPPPTRRFTITLPDSDTLPQAVGPVVAIARDGRSLLYRVARGNARHVLRRSLDQFAATAIPGAEEATNLHFSPDGAWLVFESARTLKKIPSAGGPVQTLASLTAGIRGMSWSPDGRVFFALNTQGGSLMQVAASGGAATEVYKPPDQRRVSYPQLLPDGRTALFTLSSGGTDPGETHVLRLDTSELKRVLPDATAGRVVPSGHLVFARAGSLWVIPFDLGRLETAGEAVPVAEGVRVEPGGAVQYDVADDGTLVFVPGTAASGDARTLQFVASDGRTEPVPAAPRAYSGVALSPDGSRVAAQIDVGDAADVWVVEVARGTLTRVTTESGYDGNALWSPDGQSLAFLSTRAGRWTLNRKAADGTGTVEQLATFPSPTSAMYATAWTAAGILLTLDGNIGVVAADGKGEWKPLLHSAAVETQGVLSPDGRWLAYMSTETGAPEVYLQRFPNLGERQLASVGGGTLPTWSHDGRTLTYLRGRGGPPAEVMRVTIASTGNGPARISAPSKVTDWNFYTVQFAPRVYDISQDGRLLVIGRTADEKPTAQRQINVVTNWFEELKRLAPIR